MTMSQKIKGSKNPHVSENEGNADNSILLMAMDKDRVHERLAKALFPDDEFNLMVKRVFPWSRPGRGIVEYEITVDAYGGDPSIMYAQLNPDGKGGFQDSIRVDSSPLSRVKRDSFFAGERSITLTEPDMTLSVFPLDSRILRIRDLLDSDAAIKLLGKRLIRELNVEELSITGEPKRLGYRFGKRITLMYRLRTLDAAGNHVEVPIIGKMHYDDRGRDIFNTLEQLWNRQMEAPGIRPRLLPKPICYVPEYRVYFQEAEVGNNLFEIEDGKLRRDLVVKTGAVLSSLHGTGLLVNRSHTLEDELELLGKWTGYLGVLSPELKKLAHKLFVQVNLLAEDPKVTDFKPVITHRDFFDKQVIIGKEGPVLIDLDTAAMSDPAIDVGNFVSHIFLRSIQRGGSRRNMDQESDLFVSSYLSHSEGVSSERISFYVAASLLRLACLYAFRPEWSSLCPILLEECRQRLIRI